MCLGRVVAWQRTTQQLGKRGEMGGACGQSRQSENVGKCLGGELLSLSLLALFGTLKFLNALFLGFCALFVILSLCKKATQRVARRKPQQKNPQRLKENLPFLDTSLALSMTANASLRAVFAKTAWQSINLALFLLFGLPRSLCSLAMTDKENALCHFAMTADFVILSVATQRVARRKPQQKNPHKLKENLPFLDTSLSLSMTNSGFCLKIMDIFTQILKHKFKFFTQNSRLFTNSNHLINSRHFINSTHFITLSQILSPTQGFFIFLPQVFAQFLLINSLQRSSYGRQDTKAPF